MRARLSVECIDSELENKAETQDWSCEVTVPMKPFAGYEP